MSSRNSSGAYAVLADVHGNLEALEAVLRDITAKGITEVLHAGDAVGYGPDPGPCVSLLTGSCRLLVAGNHDRAVCGLVPLEDFNESARSAVRWTTGMLGDEALRVLQRWPLRVDEDDMTLVHSTPAEPGRWNYLRSLRDAERNFGSFASRLCFIGHSHAPAIIEQEASGRIENAGNEAVIKPGCRYIVNAGSVGQPRDGDPRASYVLVQRETLTVVRVAYDVRSTALKIRSAGLPPFLAERLVRGM